MSQTQKTVLLVEDDSNDVLLLKRAFRKAGLPHDLHIVNDGDQAVAYLDGNGEYADRQLHPLPGLILLDLKLPRRSGLEVLQWIRSQASGIRDIPVIILTSSKLPGDVDRAYAGGATSYMAKPSGNYEELARNVNAAFG